MRTHAKIISVCGHALLILAVAACSKPVPKDTSTWVQRSEVKISNPDFKACVGEAMTKVQGLMVDTGNAVPDLVLATTKLNNTLEALKVEVQKTEQGTADIRFVGSGSREPDEARKAISPVLKMLTDAVIASCGGA